MPKDTSRLDPGGLLFLHIATDLLHSSVGGDSAFCGTIALPLIVGYQTITSPEAGKSMALSVQFTPVDGAETVKIVDLLTVAVPKASPAFGVAGDQLWKFDPAEGWIKYWWRTANKNWVKNGSTTTTEDTVRPGDTLLFRRGGGAAVTTITLSGAVHQFEAQPVYDNITAGVSYFIAYPWPVDFDAKTLPLYQKVGPKAAPAFGVAADQIWTYDPDLGWQKYWYRTASKAYRLNGAAADAESIMIPAGQGFMFRRGGGAAAETITFTYPAKTAAAE